MMKGNNGSGAAVAGPENAMVPMVRAPSVAAARREFSLSELNIVVPCLCPVAPVRHVVNWISTGQRFQNVCVKGAKWFRRVQELFRRGVATTSFFTDTCAG